MMELTAALAGTPAFWITLVTVAVAGLVRGFSGFGTGMIVVPVVSALYSPALAVVIIMVMDVLPMAPLVRSSFAQASLKEVVPVAIGSALALPAGLWFLANGDTLTLRWFIAGTIFVAVVLLWTGWKYTGPRTHPVRLGVGMMSGFLGGAAGISGPPVILFWMALSTGTGFVRANTILLFAVTWVLAAFGLWWNGLITAEALLIGVLASPVYLAAVLTGSRLYAGVSDATYRTIALVIILTAAIIALPALDPLIRG